MKKVLIVYLYAKTQVYIQGKEDVKDIKYFSVNGTFWYWQVKFENGEWLDITAPCILKHERV